MAVFVKALLQNGYPYAGGQGDAPLHSVYHSAYTHLAVRVTAILRVCCTDNRISIWSMKMDTQLDLPYFPRPGPQRLWLLLSLCVSTHFRRVGYTDRLGVRRDPGVANVRKPSHVKSLKCSVHHSHPSPEMFLSSTFALQPSRCTRLSRSLGLSFSLYHPSFLVLSTPSASACSAPFRGLSELLQQWR